MARRATDLGWLTKDFDLLILRLDIATGEKITNMTEEFATTTSGQKWSRRRLRLALKPPGELATRSYLVRGAGFSARAAGRRGLTAL